MPVHTAIYAAVSIWLLLALCLRISALRLRHKVFAGDGGIVALQAASRAHGVSVEHLVPLLILLLIFELLGAKPALVDAFGITILAARILHVAGFLLPARPWGRVRQLGIGITYAIEGVLPLLLVTRALSLWR